MKKALALLLSAAMIFSIVACDKASKSGSSDDDVIEIAESFASSIKNGKTKGFTKVIEDSKDEDLISLFEQITTSSEFDGDTKKVHDAVFETIAYEIDEDSVDTSKKGSKVDVTFSVVNYEKVSADDYDDVDEYIDALGSQKKTIDTVVTLEIEEDDGDMYVSNAEDALEDLYVWKDLEVEFEEVVETVITETVETDIVETEPVSSGYADAVEDVMFFFEGDSYYSPCEFSNTVAIECDILIADGYEDLYWESQVICDIYYENEYIGSSFVTLLEDDNDYYALCFVAIQQFPELQDEDTLYLKAGDYTFVFCDENDNPIAQDTCSVVYNETGYVFDATVGTSSHVDDIMFIDYYFIGTTGFELDMYMTDRLSDFTFSYTVSKDGKVLYTAEETTSYGIYIPVWMVPSDFDASELKTGDYVVDVYDDESELVFTSTFTLE